MTDQGPISEKRSEEEIANEIYKNRERIDYEDEKKFSGYILRYENKELRIVFARLTNGVSTYIHNISEDDVNTPGETTLIFKAANKIIQDWANEVGKPIRHAFTTEDEKLKAWAQDPAKGGQIFDPGYTPREGIIDIEMPKDPKFRKALEKRMTFSVFIEPQKE